MAVLFAVLLKCKYIVTKLKKPFGNISKWLFFEYRITIYEQGFEKFDETSHCILEKFRQTS